MLVTSGFLSSFPEPVCVTHDDHNPDTDCGTWTACTVDRSGAVPTTPPHMSMWEDTPPVQHVVGAGPLGRIDMSSPPWAGLDGLAGMAPDLGVVPWDCVGLVFESSEAADRAFDVLSAEGYVVAYPKEMPQELPPWVHPMVHVNRGEA